MMEEALRELGVTPATLSAADKEQLDRQGYLVVEGVLGASQTDAMVAALDDLASAEGANAGNDFHTEAGTTRLGSLISKSDCFDICPLHPRALAAIAHIMGPDFGLSSITGRAALPGEGHQALHRDSGELAANALWIVSEFTAQNGPTRLIPGSHRFAGPPEKLLADAAAPHPDEVYLIAPAGSLVVINGATWHGGTRNNSALPRHLVSAFFTPRGGYQSISHRRLSPAAERRLSPEAAYVLDHLPAEATPAL